MQRASAPSVLQRPAHGGGRGHLVDLIFPPLPVRQWVLSVPKRLRWYLEREPQAVSALLHILLRVIDGYLRQVWIDIPE